jgi:hypothetical protein
MRVAEQERIWSEKVLNMSGLWAVIREEGEIPFFAGAIPVGIAMLHALCAIIGF